MGYRNIFLKGMGWNGSVKVISKLVAVIKLAIISRLLGPDDFGIFALTLIAISFFEVFTETGINILILQSKQKIEHFVNTAWIISLIRGVLISGLIVGAAYPMSQFYHEPQLPRYILVSALIPLVRGLINPAIITLYRDMKYTKDAIFKLTLLMIETTLSIVLAFVIRNPLALLLPMLISAIVEVILSFALFKPRPIWEFNKTVFKEITHGMKWLNALTIFEYLRKTIDDITVGRMLGTSSLGVYRAAFNLPQASTAEGGTAIMYSVFPVFKHILNDNNRLKKAFWKVLFGSSALLLIPTLLMIAFPQQIIHVILGSQWQTASQVLPYLAIAAYIHGVITIGSTLLTARAAYAQHVAMIGVSCLVLAITLFPLIQVYGLPGAGWSVLLSRLVTIPIFFWFINKHLHPKNLDSAQIDTKIIE